MRESEWHGPWPAQSCDCFDANARGGACIEPAGCRARQWREKSNGEGTMSVQKTPRPWLRKSRAEDAFWAGEAPMGMRVMEVSAAVRDSTGTTIQLSAGRAASNR